MSDQAANPESTAKSPRMVSRFEANLLRLLRYFLQQLPFDQALPLLQATLTPPKCLSANAIYLVQDSLSKGCVLYLVESGGWRNEKFLRRSQPKSGRLWERSSVEELTLHFSAQSLELLIWITANRFVEKATQLSIDVARLTPADQLLVFLIYEGLLNDQESLLAVRTVPLFAANPLCRIGYPDHFAGTQGLPEPDYAPWFRGLGSLILESLQTKFRDRWLFLERTKGQIGEWNFMRDRGRAEFQVLESLCNAAEVSHRLDLLRFFLDVLSRILTGDMSPSFWTGGLHGNAPARLADRLETQRAALSLLRFVERFHGWERRARTSGYLDEDYAESKFFLSEWERFDGNRVASIADRVVQQIEPLRPNNPVTE